MERIISMTIISLIGIMLMYYTASFERGSSYQVRINNRKVKCNVIIGTTIYCVIYILLAKYVFYIWGEDISNIISSVTALFCAAGYIYIVI